jgi:hypothetical protein
MTRGGRLHRRAHVVEMRIEATGRDLQGTAVELVLVAPFLQPRDLDRWRARVTTWQRAAAEDAALLGRLDGILARYTGGR